MYYLKHEQQYFIRYKDTRQSRVFLGLRDKTRTANVLRGDFFVCHVTRAQN
jgi:hypothetical protein